MRLSSWEIQYKWDIPKSSYAEHLGYKTVYKHVQEERVFFWKILKKAGEIRVKIEIIIAIVPIENYEN